ncbi:hypothetical protein LMG26696_01219 [Achromobacter pulmonis]|nr:hypothetical protein LMG26696_01219 [Achromobacter pulmonis]
MNAVGLPGLRPRGQGEMHAAGDQGVGLQGMRRPVRLRLRQLNAAACRQLQCVELAILCQLPGGIVAQTDGPPLPLIRLLADREAAKPRPGALGGAGAVARCVSLLQREQVNRRGGGGAEQQILSGLRGAGGGAVTELRDPQPVAAAAQPGVDGQAVMIAAVGIDPEHKGAIRGGDRIGRQAVGGPDCRGWRRIHGQGGGGRRERLRHECVSCPAVVVEAQLCVVRLELAQRGVSRDDPAGMIVHLHAGPCRIHGSGVLGFRCVGYGWRAERDAADGQAGEVAERMAARRQVQACIVARQGDGLGEVMGRARGRAGQCQGGAVRHRDGAIAIPAAGCVETRAGGQGQRSAAEVAAIRQRRLIGNHGDGAVAGVDGASEFLADFQRRVFLQRDLSLVAALVGIGGGDGGAAFRFLRQSPAVVPVDVQQRAAQDDARAARIDVALQGGVARQAEGGVRQRQAPDGKLARFPIRLVERYGLRPHGIIAEVAQRLCDVRRVDGMDDGMPLENQFALPRGEGVGADGDVAIGDKHGVRLVEDGDVDIVFYGSREDEFRLGGEVFPLALVRLLQRGRQVLPGVFPVVVAGLGSQGGNGGKAVLLQDEIAQAALVQVASQTGARPLRHDDVVGDFVGIDGAEVDRHARLLRGAVGDRGAMVPGVARQLIERDVIAVDIQDAAARAPLDAVRVDLPGVAQHDFGPPAGKGDGVECLDAAVGIRLLGQDHLAVAYAQAAGVEARAADGQGASAYLVQVVAGYAIDVPLHVDVILHVDAAAYPGLVRVGGNDVVVMEGQRARALVNGVFQPDVAATGAVRRAKGDVLSRIQAREVERAVAERKGGRLFIAVHGVRGASGLFQRARALRAVECPSQNPVARGVDDVRVVIFVHDAGDKVIRQVRPVNVATLLGHGKIRRRAGKHPLFFTGIPGEQGGPAVALFHE